MLDQLFISAFASASAAIFEVGSIMAILMLIFGILDYRYGDRLREIIEHRRLDKPWIMVLLALIPVDGTLLFQYASYRRRSIRLGSLLGGLIGIGEEATYLVLSYQPLAWVVIAVIKLVTAVGAGSLLNRLPGVAAWTDSLHQRDAAVMLAGNVIQADENFHELPDKFRHKLHHFRYHELGKFFWIFFGLALVLQLGIQAYATISGQDADRFRILNIPIFHWLAMLGLMVIVIYRIVIAFFTREFGKIFEHEFEDAGDAIGDLAETCTSVIILIFLLTFVVDTLVSLIGTDRLAAFFAGRAILTILAGALIGLVPGTGASLAFTTLYFALAQTDGALPFAALVACSIALIGDSQIVGSQQIRLSQQVLHWISFGLALAVGLAVYGLQQLFGLALPIS